MNIEDYRKTIQDIEGRIGSARLMAVSKTRTLEEIMAVYQAGVRLFGENHVQEIVAKFSGKRPSDMEVHMIGHLQSNKVGKVVPLVDMIESVDSLELLRKINNAAARIGKTMDVLLEFNTSNEAAKSGFLSTGDLFACLDEAGGLGNVRVRGLMTVGPVDCAPEQKDELTDRAFKELVAIRKECQARYPGLDFGILSMGMSQDYMIGVRNGSTEVRIGTSIFGPRDYSRK
ncbi:MAG: YggS family pyridoxal phosphate-dependent enzyme [Spirochaetales bacterium]|nr:YggS family pyridoxal phosphate-dependent enzyme [Spirochaetales bacterium]